VAGAKRFGVRLRSFAELPPSFSVSRLPSVFHILILGGEMNDPTGRLLTFVVAVLSITILAALFMLVRYA
jgi:hypothetical protein